MSEDYTDIKEVLRTLGDCANLCEKALCPRKSNQMPLTNWQREIYEKTYSGLQKELF